MADDSQLRTVIDWFLIYTPYSDGPGSVETFLLSATPLPNNQIMSERSMLSILTAAMPHDMQTYFLGTGLDDANDFAGVIYTDFRLGARPSWFTQLPSTVQTYFFQHVQAVLDVYDILGSRSSVETGLQITTDGRGVPGTTIVNYTIAYAESTFQGLTSWSLTCKHPSQSEIWSYLAMLTSAIPAPIRLLASSNSKALATAVYSQFSSGTPPTWFTAMPTKAQSYVIFEWLPNNMQQPMTIDVLALASPAATPTSGPTATSAPTATEEPKYRNQLTSSQKREGNIVAATIVPTVALIAIGILIWYIMRRRRARQATLAAKSQRPVDPEQAMQRWSQTTFSTAVQSSHHHTEPSRTSPMGLPVSPNSDGSFTIRRTLSESDVRSSSGLRKELAEIELPASQIDRVELEASPSKSDRTG